MILSIVIPARNEEVNLSRLLGSVPHVGGRSLELLVVDDGSTDRTAEVARAAGARVISLSSPPEGWTGKAWACQQGAQSASGEILLFLDADTWFPEGGFAAVLEVVDSLTPHEALSILPFHRMEKTYEQLSAFFHIVMAIGTGSFAHSSLRAKTILVGQSLLLFKSAYFSIGGYSAVKGQVLENLFLSRELNAKGILTRTLRGADLLEMRMFPEGAASLAKGWAKAFSTGAPQVDSRVLGFTIAWITALFSIPTLLFIFPWAGIALYFLFAFQLHSMLGKIGNYTRGLAILYPIPLVFFAFVFFASAVARRAGFKFRWRGRVIPS